MPGLTNGLECRDTLQEDLPTIEFCATHLRLLESFVILSDKVRDWARSRQSDHDASWVAFVRLAALRFNRWFGSVSDAAIQTSLPPLDVLMVWHSFMLNPRSYADFCKTARPNGSGGHGIPWSLVREAIAADSATFTLSKLQTKHVALLDLSPDLLESLKNICEARTEVPKLIFAEIRRIEAEDAKLTSRFPPPIDLAAAVHRQAAFALKMTRFGWIHSPHADSILQRAVARYSNFFSLFAVAGHAAVPAIDIDLIWHTHQLSPARYALFSAAAAGGRFINHNDDIEQEAISSAFASTERLYRGVFGEEYAVCNGWFCEAARLKPDGVLSVAELAAVRSVIEDLNWRNRKLGLPVALDLAECDCCEAGMGGVRRGPEGESLGCGDCGSGCGGGCSGCSGS